MVSTVCVCVCVCVEKERERERERGFGECDIMPHNVHTLIYCTCTTPEQALGWFPQGLGLVMEDEPSELSSTCTSQSTHLSITIGASGSVMEWSTLFRPALFRAGTHSTCTCTCQNHSHCHDICPSRCAFGLILTVSVDECLCPVRSLTNGVLEERLHSKSTATVFMCR